MLSDIITQLLFDDVQVTAAASLAGPGVTHVAWATSGAGKDAVERVFERSARLNGDAVVVFMRSLAAISQEELVPIVLNDKPRCGSADMSSLFEKPIQVHSAHCPASRLRIILGI